MNTYVKIFFKTLLIVSLLLLIMLGLIFFSNYQKRRSIERKLIEKSKVCSANDTITQYPIIELSNFTEEDLATLSFQVLRNSRIVKDTTIFNVKKEKYSTRLLIPVINFLKTDTILVTTKSNLHYKISNFKYVVGTYHGMFGPVGVSDCELDDNSMIINTVEHTNVVSKFYGVLLSENNTKRIPASSEKCKALLKKVNFDTKRVDSIIANDIFQSRRGKYGGIDYGLEVTKNEVFCIRGIQTDYNTIDIIKVNVKTGRISKRLENYPVDNE